MVGEATASNVITSADLMRPAPSLVNPTGSPMGGFDLKEVQTIMSQFKDILGTFQDIMKFKSQMTGEKAQTQGFNGTATQQPPTAPYHGAPHPIVQEKIVYRPMEIDQNKVKQLLNELLSQTLPEKIPQEFQEKKLSDFLGENWTNIQIPYKYMGMNITLTAEILSEKIAEGLVKNLESLKKDES